MRSAGVIPEMRLAWPRLTGRMARVFALRCAVAARRHSRTVKGSLASPCAETAHLRCLPIHIARGISRQHHLLDHSG